MIFEDYTFNFCQIYFGVSDLMAVALSPLEASSIVPSESQNHMDGSLADMLAYFAFLLHGDRVMEVLGHVHLSNQLPLLA